MKKQIDTHLAWRDADYFLSLTEEERAQLPEGPVGAIQLSDDDLRAASGLATAATNQSWCFNSACLTHCICAC